MAINKSEMFFTDHGKVLGVACCPFDAWQHPLHVRYDAGHWHPW